MLAGFASCDLGGPFENPGSAISGRWVYRAVELRGATVTCSTTEVVLTLQAFGSLRVDAAFSGTGSSFRMDCSSGGRSTTLFFTDGTSVLNGQEEDGVVSFDFSSPDFLHTGLLTDGTMEGTVATRLDLTGTPLGEAGVVNLVGSWAAVRATGFGGRASPGGSRGRIPAASP